MKGTQILLLCLASGNISCRGFREAVASQEGKCAESSSLLTAKRSVLSRAGGMVTSERPSPKPRDLVLAPCSSPCLLPPPNLCSLPVGPSGSMCWFCAVGHWMQAVEGIAQRPSLVPLCPPSPNCTSGSLPKTFGGLWWVTFGCMVNLPWAESHC